MATKVKTYDKKFNATRGAQRAGLKPGTFEVFKTPDGRFTWRAVASSAPTNSNSKPAAATQRPSKGKDPAESGGSKMGNRKMLIEQAQAGVLPNPPDFSKPTHARFRAKLTKLVSMAEAGNLEGLRATEINPVSTSPKAMARYRDLAVLAIQSRKG